MLRVCPFVFFLRNKANKSLTGRYLEDTNNVAFRLVAYGRSTCTTEFWQCLECQKCIEFDFIQAGMQRDMMHEKGRKDHLRFACKKVDF